MKRAIIGVLLVVAACAQPETQWVKSGATQADFQRDAYECERDTRAVAYTFTPGVIMPAIEAQAFATRCMAAKGWALATTSSGYAPAPAPVVVTPQRDAAGRQYGDDERVFCSFPNAANPHIAKVDLAARVCSQGGGTILGPVS